MTPSPVNRLILGKDEWSSIYLPQISNTLVLNEISSSPEPGEIVDPTDKTTPITEDVLIWMFEKSLELGKVKRVDYITRASVGSNPPVRSAFVHFEYWYDTENVHLIRENMIKFGVWKWSIVNDHDRRVSMHFMDTINGKFTVRYLNLKINAMPIPEADPNLNIHQLAVAKSALEQQVLNLTEANRKLEATQLIDILREVKCTSDDLGDFINQMLCQYRPDLVDLFVDNYYTDFQDAK